MTCFKIQWTYAAIDALPVGAWLLLSCRGNSTLWHRQVDRTWNSVGMISLQAVNSDSSSESIHNGHGRCGTLRFACAIVNATEAEVRETAERFFADPENFIPTTGASTSVSTSVSTYVLPPVPWRIVPSTEVISRSENCALVAMYNPEGEYLHCHQLVDGNWYSFDVNGRHQTTVSDEWMLFEFSRAGTVIRTNLGGTRPPDIHDRCALILDWHPVAAPLTMRPAPLSPLDPDPFVDPPAGWTRMTAWDESALSAVDGAERPFAAYDVYGAMISPPLYRYLDGRFIRWAHLRSDGVCSDERFETLRAALSLANAAYVMYAGIMTRCPDTKIAYAQALAFDPLQAPSRDPFAYIPSNPQSTEKPMSKTKSASVQTPAVPATAVPAPIEPPLAAIDVEIRNAIGRSVELFIKQYEVDIRANAERSAREAAASAARETAREVMRGGEITRAVVASLQADETLRANLITSAVSGMALDEDEIIKVIIDDYIKPDDLVDRVERRLIERVADSLVASIGGVIIDKVVKDVTALVWTRLECSVASSVETPSVETPSVETPVQP
jgi:hypothetical protein